MGKVKESKSWVLGVDCYEIGEQTFLICLVNDKEIIIKMDVECNGVIWKYKIDTQYFSNFNYACNYLQILIAEKLTGNRIICHTKRQAPEICGGGEGKGCRRPGECNRALCSNCPVAEAFFAKRDNVNLIYAVL